MSGCAGICSFYHAYIPENLRPSLHYLGLKKIPVVPVPNQPYFFSADPIGLFQKRYTPPPRRKFLPSGGGGETKLFLIIVNVLGHPKGVGGLTSNFLRGGGMDVFWNDPLFFQCN